MEKAAFEKAKSGELYNDLLPIYSQQRQKVALQLKKYNQLYGEDEEARQEILREILGSVGKDAFFENDFRCEFGRNIHIGDYFYANFDCILLDGAEINIGNYVLFGPRVGIFTTNHGTDAMERAAGACYSKAVNIGDHVWLGANVTINQGVTIGANSIVGSGSVVTKNIPENVIAVGNPCRVLRKITSADKTDYLKKAGLLDE